MVLTAKPAFHIWFRDLRLTVSLFISGAGGIWSGIMLEVTAGFPTNSKTAGIAGSAQACWADSSSKQVR